jgi:hypothetical protein
VRPSTQRPQCNRAGWVGDLFDLGHLSLSSPAPYFIIGFLKWEQNRVAAPYAHTHDPLTSL